jgi:hypothetical protein
MLRSDWLSPSPRGEGSFFSMVAEVFFVTIPLPWIIICTIFRGSDDEVSVVATLDTSKVMIK